MKRIKLFENFNALNPIDVRDDIKSVLYELEDMGFDVSFNAHVSTPGNYIDDKIDASKIEEIEPGKIVHFFTIIVKRKNTEFSNFFPNVDELTDVKEKLKWFHELLTDHLDYINPKKIRLENAGRYISISLPN